jgi:Cu-Zn family superoxide dismutase
MNALQPNHPPTAARLARRFCLLLISAAILAAGCQHHTGTQSANSNELAANTVTRSAFAVIMPSMDATTQPANNNVTGAVVFTQTAKGVMIIADIAGLEPNSRHAIAIHQSGDLSAPDLSSAGERFNPYHRPHGGPGTQPVQAGDLGNLTADANGNAHFELHVNDISIGTDTVDDIAGKSVIIHANPDDLSSQPAGNSGPRVAGGVIKLRMPASQP